MVEMTVRGVPGHGWRCLHDESYPVPKRDAVVLLVVVGDTDYLFLALGDSPGTPLLVDEGANGLPVGSEEL